MRYRIQSMSGVLLGVYTGSTPEEAVAAMHEDAGGFPYDRDPMSELIVTAVTPIAWPFPSTFTPPVGRIPGPDWEDAPF